ncbi:serine/threonine-protein kinase [Nocardia panacis]|uniref:serine/threonine-protein kinase n=1 Tax=Nocardia panacis TaxID=2340916 RepID=UPI00249EB1EE|nr:serine/threonine-protein kinase [Nocardia panacis]
MEVEVGATFAGYVIEGVLGQGGMGTVFLARHPRLPRMVALKLLNRSVSSDAEMRARFDREANVVARLDHPGIVGIHDRGVDNGHLWIAMQYVQGIDAARLDIRTLAVERALRIVEDTAEALDYAHAQGVLHRDIKPANILLAAPAAGRAERAVLTDFGIARLQNSNTHLTVTGTFTATLAFASPEQLSGEVVDHRADQYSLACTLFALLTGAAPFAGDNPGQVITGHLSRPVPPLGRPDLPPALDAVIARAMGKSRAERFGSCTEFVASARAALSGAQAARRAPTMLGPAHHLPGVHIPPHRNSQAGQTGASMGPGHAANPHRTAQAMAGNSMGAPRLASGAPAPTSAAQSGFPQVPGGRGTGQHAVGGAQGHAAGGVVRTNPGRVAGGGLPVGNAAVTGNPYAARNLEGARQSPGRQEAARKAGDVPAARKEAGVRDNPATPGKSPVVGRDTASRPAQAGSGSRSAGAFTAWTVVVLAFVLGMYAAMRAEAVWSMWFAGAASARQVARFEAIEPLAGYAVMALFLLPGALALALRRRGGRTLVVLGCLATIGKSLLEITWGYVRHLRIFEDSGMVVLLFAAFLLLLAISRRTARWLHARR